MLTKYLYVFFVSMVPLIELRGAIPIGVGLGLPLSTVYIISIIGNMLPVPFIYLFARAVLEWGKDKPVIGKFFTCCLEKGEKGGKKLQATAGRGLVIALLRMSRFKLVSVPIRLYILIMRGTPLILQIFTIYFFNRYMPIYYMSIFSIS